jgi:uncharacterized C2H2 Zn-finger protein
MDRDLKTAQRPATHPDDELAPAPGDLRCAHCEAEFDSTEDLDAHLRQAHSLSAPRVVRCPECQAEFGTENEAAIHRREAHGAPV